MIHTVGPSEILTPCCCGLVPQLMDGKSTLLYIDNIIGFQEACTVVMNNDDIL
jgi:hypothetical protein